VLDECLRQYGADRARAFAEYEARRKLHVDTLADLCLVNFVEMRDRVGSQWFVLRKRLEIALHALLGQGYLPLYTMIEFTRIPYADALRRARWQDRIVTLLGLGFLLAVLLVAYWLVASR
jgi:kynurenine 3-monooxygenase